jgi:energy-coupling factor transport system permease protein
MSRPPANEFEFLRGLPFGPYLPLESPLHRLDPRTRILITMVLMAALVISQSAPGLLVGLVIITSAWRVARVPYEPLLRGWRAALPFLLFLAALQILLRAGGRNEPVLIVVGPVAASAADLLAAAGLLLRFASFVGILGLAAASLSESELTRGLQFLLRPLAALRLPVHDFVAIIQVTLRYFPLLAQTAERIAKAQASRGADWSPAGWNIVRRVRQYIPLMVPLFITSLRRAENMALAMDSRGYGSRPTRTLMADLRYQPGDYAALALTFLLALVIVLL